MPPPNPGGADSAARGEREPPKNRPFLPDILPEGPLFLINGNHDPPKTRAREDPPGPKTRLSPTPSSPPPRRGQRAQSRGPRPKPPARGPWSQATGQRSGAPRRSPRGPRAPSPLARRESLQSPRPRKEPRGQGAQRSPRSQRPRPRSPRGPRLRFQRSRRGQPSHSPPRARRKPPVQERRSQKPRPSPPPPRGRGSGFLAQALEAVGRGVGAQKGSEEGEKAGGLRLRLLGTQGELLPLHPLEERPQDFVENEVLPQIWTTPRERPRGVV